MENKKEFKATCHCGGVGLDVRLAKSTIWTCTCTICLMRGGHWVYVDKSDMKIEQGNDLLKTYRYNTMQAQNNFCSNCGIHIFSQPRSFPDRWALRIECIKDFPVEYFHDEHREFDGFNWEENITNLRAAEAEANEH